MNTFARWNQNRILQQTMHANQRKNRSGWPVLYLFLDFDGVINVPYEVGTHQYAQAVDTGDFRLANQHCIERLSRLCLEFKPKVIITSSWRYSGLDYCRQYLQESGLDKQVNVCGMLPVEEEDRRENQILHYLAKHPDYEGILVLDDMKMDVLADYQVRTEFDFGYTDDCDKKARAIFQRSLKREVS